MKMTRLLLIISMAALIGFAGCAAKNTDADIKTDIENKLKATRDMSGVVVDVKNGIATIEGQCQDDACKIKCEKIAQEVNGVKTVINDLTVTTAPAVTDTIAAAIAAPMIAAMEDPLIESVQDVIKRFPGAKADVKDSIITLTGNIKKTEVPKLIKALTSLKPKKIEKKFTSTKNVRAAKQPKHKKRSRRR